MNIAGHRIRVARAINRPPLTQQDITIQLQIQGYKISKSLISKIENGKRGISDIELKAIARVLNVSVSWLLEDSDNMPKIEKGL